MGQIVQRGVLVEDLENEQMDRVGGIEQSIFPEVVLLAAGGVDGLLVQEIGHVLPDAPQDADKSGDAVASEGPPIGQDGLTHPSVRRRTLTRSAGHNCHSH